MDNRRIARELVTVAKDLMAEEDPAEAARLLILSYRGRLYLFRDALADLERVLASVKRQQEGLEAAGAGATESQTLLEEPLRKAEFLAEITADMARTIRKAKDGH